MYTSERGEKNSFPITSVNMHDEYSGDWAMHIWQILFVVQILYDVQCTYIGSKQWLLGHAY